MEELQSIKIRMEVVNQYGERIAIEQEVVENDVDLSEIKIYHKAYLKFLGASGFAVDAFNKVVILEEDCDCCCDCE